MKQDEILSILQSHYPTLSEEYGVKRIGLFGSFARGTDRADSDVDLVVEFERPIGFRFVQLVEYLETLLGRPVDVLTPAGLQGIRVARVAEDIASSVVYA